MSSDSLRVALKGLFAHRMRSFLTMLGVLIGTAGVIMVIAVGRGLSNAVQYQIRTLGTNSAYILPQFQENRAGTSTHKLQLTKDDVDALRDRGQAPDIVAVAPNAGASGTVTWRNTSYPLQNFLGVPPVYGQIRNAWMDHGRWLTDEDEATHAHVAVIGKTVVSHLFPPGVDPVGQGVVFNGVRFRLVGYMVPKGSNGFLDQDDVLIAPLSTTIDEISGNSGTFPWISIEASSPDRIDAAMTEARAVLRRSHGLKAKDPPDFIVFNAAATLAAGRAAARAFQLLLGTVAAIFLLIGGIGIMNIMLVTVAERTREIGIRKSLGARRSDILFQFLVESIMLSAIGGAIGVALGILGGSHRAGPMKPVISFPSVVVAFTVSVAIGVIFGAWPASRAAALTPMDALRYE